MMKKRAFQNCLTRHKDHVYSYTLYMLKNKEDAEDVTQDVFIKLWNYWDRVDKQYVKGWLLKVAYNRCIDLIRQKKTTGEQAKMRNDIEITKLVCEMDSSQNPDAYLNENEMRIVLLKAMEQLPEKTKSMLLMHYFQDLKYETISEIMETSLSSVKVSIFRGKKILRSLLLDYYPERVKGQSDEMVMS